MSEPKLTWERRDRPTENIIEHRAHIKIWAIMPTTYQLADAVDPDELNALLRLQALPHIREQAQKLIEDIDTELGTDRAQWERTAWVRPVIDDG